tara:strand:- start:54 stop:284 length:231 start_codon:yes stop_codon:yes gene_type:complete
MRYGVNINALAYYLYNADFELFKEDIFEDDNFTDEYVQDKFREFQDNFSHFLYSLSNNHRAKLAEASMKLYLMHNR